MLTRLPSLMLAVANRHWLTTFSSADTRISPFFRDDDKVFRTYFINSRGDEAMGTTWSYLDITPLGRQETWEDSPEGYPQTPPYMRPRAMAAEKASSEM